MIKRIRLRWLGTGEHEDDADWVNSAFHPSGVGKSSTSLLAGVNAGHVHLCRVAGVIMCDPIWQVTSRSCEMGTH